MQRKPSLPSFPWFTKTPCVPIPCSKLYVCPSREISCIFKQICIYVPVPYFYRQQVVRSAALNFIFYTQKYMTIQHFILWQYRISFSLSSPIGGQLGYWKSLAIISNASCRCYNTHVQEYPQDKILKGELLSPGVYTLLILLCVAKLPSCRLYSCAVPSAICEFICFPTCSSTQSVVKLTFQVLSILWIKSDIIWQLSFVFLLLPLT